LPPRGRNESCSRTNLAAERTSPTPSLLVLFLDCCRHTTHAVETPSANRRLWRNANERTKKQSAANLSGVWIVSRQPVDSSGRQPVDSSGSTSTNCKSTDSKKPTDWKAQPIDGHTHIPADATAQQPHGAHVILSATTHHDAPLGCLVC